MNDKAKEIAQSILSESIGDQNNIIREMLAIIKKERRTQKENIIVDADNFDKLYIDLSGMINIKLDDEPEKGKE